MQVALAFAVLAATVAHHYGYALVPHLNAVRVYSALAGVESLVVWALVLHMVWHRLTDWRAVMILLCAAVIGIVESSMAAVCRGWYAFIYSGPQLTGNICTELTGWHVSWWFVAAIAVWLFVMLAGVWLRRDSDSFSNTGFFVGYKKPGSLNPLKLAAMLALFPFAGKVWIVNGVCYGYRDGRMQVIPLELCKYRLVRVSRRPNAWEGKKWSLLHNCLTN